MHRASFQFTPRGGISTRPDGVAATGLRPGQSADDGETLAVYAERWLAGVNGAVRRRTFESYSAQLRLHVLPRLGHLRITDLTVDDVLGLVDNLRAAGYTGWTIRTTLTPLSRLLNHAVRRGVIVVSPMSQLDRTERPVVWTADQKILSRDEITRLLECAPRRFQTLLTTAIFTGLRQGELLGLQWAEIDLDLGVIRVRKSLDRHGERQDPKTRHALRDVVLMPALAQRLIQQRANSDFSAPTDFVFSSRRGTALHWRNVARRALQPALETAGLPHLRWHDLRHTYASLLISEGANIVYVSRQLGHGSSDITLRCYSHLFDHAEHAERTRAFLEASFGAVVHDGGVRPPAI